MNEKTKEQFLIELLELQKELDEKVRHQDQMIHRFQLYSKNEGLFSGVVDSCPYPIAVFTALGILEKINDAFTEQTGIKSEDIESGKLSIYSCFPGNDEFCTAIRQALKGQTQWIEELKSPPFKPSKENSPTDVPAKHYKKVTVFPIPSEDGVILHGVAIFSN
ncbi:hypothetical protein SDC9_64178 [bioreactor metagenome]|uniref:PAS domain-containing protein n=1 Tax=bioreactor metagenome TaxID=1076179 RepID=A0A644XNR2_9ZZZZ